MLPPTHLQDPQTVKIEVEQREFASDDANMCDKKSCQT